MYIHKMSNDNLLPLIVFPIPAKTFAAEYIKKNVYIIVSAAANTHTSAGLNSNARMEAKESCMYIVTVYEQ